MTLGDPINPAGTTYSNSTFVTKDSGETDVWAAERADVLARFASELERATGDGSKKRQAGTKPPWYQDGAHEGAIFSHLTKWKRGEQIDPDSGAHPLVHAAWRCLAIACRESGNVPEAEDARPVTVHNHTPDSECWNACPSAAFPHEPDWRHEYPDAEVPS